MAEKTIRVGLIGSGFIGKVHSIAYGSLANVYGHSLPKIERVRLADVTTELAQTGAARLGWQEGTGDWRDITRAPDIDLVDITTPNYAHAEIAIDAARHGKHILCEKPLAHTVELARQMYEEVRAAGVVHQVAFGYHRWPAVMFAKELIESGRIGQPIQFRLQYLIDYALNPDMPLSWRFQKEKAGWGAIGDVGSHAIDLARFLVGEVSRVSAVSRTFIKRRPLPAEGDISFGVASYQDAKPAVYGEVDVDDATSFLLEFDDGAIGTIDVNWMAGGHDNEVNFEVSGERGAIRFNWQHANEIQLYCAEDHPERLNGFRTIIIGPLHPGAVPSLTVPGLGMGFTDAFLIAVKEMVDAITAGRPASPNFLDGLRACEVIEAVQEAAKERSWVEVKRSLA